MNTLQFELHDQIGAHNWTHLQVRRVVSAAIADLLENKHLYQSVTVSGEPIDQRIETTRFRSEVARTPRAMEHMFNEMKTSMKALVAADLSFVEWRLGTYIRPFRQQLLQAGERMSALAIEQAPTVTVLCDRCDQIWPHNSGYDGWQSNMREWLLPGSGQEVEQLFLIPYQCQKCRGSPVVFMIMRRGAKMPIVGRSIFERVKIPDYLRNVPGSEHYSHAAIAFNSNHVLAGLFYLRTFIEQYWRTILGCEDLRMTGEDLANAYKERLPDDWPTGRVGKSLGRVYDELSEKLHAADASAE